MLSIFDIELPIKSNLHIERTPERRSFKKWHKNQFSLQLAVISNHTFATAPLLLLETCEQSTKQNESKCV